MTIMTEADKAAQLGQVMMDIRKHEDELQPLLVEARRIGAALTRIGQALEASPFGVSDAKTPVIPNSVAGGTFGSVKHFLDSDKLSQLERDIQGHVRELQRLRSLKSQLGF